MLPDMLSLISKEAEVDIHMRGPHANAVDCMLATQDAAHSITESTWTWKLLHICITTCSTSAAASHFPAILLLSLLRIHEMDPDRVPCHRDDRIYLPGIRAKMDLGTSHGKANYVITAEDLATMHVPQAGEPTADDQLATWRHNGPSLSKNALQFV